MTSTYEKIATTTLANSTTTSVSFSSISSSYTDLIVIMNVGAATSGSNVELRFNGDTGSNYSRTVTTGTGVIYNERLVNQTSITLTFGAYLPFNLFQSNIILNIQNYSNTTTYKTVLNRSNTASEGTDLNVGLWRSTSAINDVTLICRGAGYYYLSGSTFTLYGIKAE
jgi:hypothetical protein